MSGRLLVTAKFLTAAAIILAACSAFAEQPLKRYQLEGYAVSIPADWVAIPPDELERFHKNLSAQLGRRAPRYKYAFQAPGKWFDFPSVLIEENYKSPISDAEVARFDKVGAAALEKLAESAPTLLAETSMQSSYYEEERDRIWTRLQVARPGAAPATVLSGINRTSAGYVSVNANIESERYPAFADTFRAIISSFEWGNAAASSANKGQRVISDNVVAGVVMCMLLAAAFLGLRRYRGAVPPS